MKLSQADRYAAFIVDWLRPHCCRIEIVGSIRRRRPEPNDIDLICIPKLVEKKDLLGSVESVENSLRTYLIKYVSDTARIDGGLTNWRSGTEPEWDAQNLLVKLPKCEVDIWCANEENFATRQLCRTGSKEHNIWIAQRAKDLGGHWHPYKGLTLRNGFVPATTEAQIYEALNLSFIPPEKRESGQFESFVRSTRMGKATELVK